MKITPISYNLSNFTSRYRTAQNISNADINSIKFNELKNKDSYQKIERLYSDGVKPTDRTYDSFTGMRDKNYLLATLSQIMKNAKKTSSNFSIAMFDMDNFKSINELLGYETGDKFIKVIAKNISSEAKKNNIEAYRFGGEEFVILFKNETPEKKKEIVNNIISSINSDKYLESKKSLFLENAYSSLNQYLSSSGKINAIMSLRERKGILDDLSYNFTSEEAKNDRYFNRKRDDTGYELQCAYLSLINDSIETEPDERTKAWLIETRDNFSKNPYVSKQDEDNINEYLRMKYDKTQEVYQLKKWMSDFKQNNGFSITGAIVTFTPDSIKDKNPINLIDDSGKVLKSGKHQKKGEYYCCMLI